MRKYNRNKQKENQNWILHHPFPQETKKNKEKPISTNNKYLLSKNILPNKLTSKNEIIMKIWPLEKLAGKEVTVNVTFGYKMKERA